MTTFDGGQYRLIDGSGDGFFRIHDSQDLIQDQDGNEVSKSQFIEKFPDFPEKILFLQDGQSLDGTQNVSQAFAPGYVRTQSPVQAGRGLKPSGGLVALVVVGGAALVGWALSRDQKSEPTPGVRAYVPGQDGAWVDFTVPKMFPGADDQELTEGDIDPENPDLGLENDSNEFVIYNSVDGDEDEFDDGADADDDGPSIDDFEAPDEDLDAEFDFALAMIVDGQVEEGIDRLVSLGRRSEAAEALEERAAKLADGDALNKTQASTAYYRAAELHREEGDAEAALAAYQKARELAGDVHEAVATQLIAELHAELNQPQQAGEEYLRLAGLREAAEDRDGAREAFQNAADQFATMSEPDWQRAGEAMQRVGELTGDHLGAAEAFGTSREAFEQAGNQAQAAEVAQAEAHQYGEAMDLKKTAEAQLRAAKLLRESDQVDEAVRILARAAFNAVYVNDTDLIPLVRAEAEALYASAEHDELRAATLQGFINEALELIDDVLEIDLGGPKPPPQERPRPHGGFAMNLFEAEMAPPAADPEPKPNYDDVDPKLKDPDEFNLAVRFLEEIERALAALQELEVDGVPEYLETVQERLAAIRTQAQAIRDAFFTDTNASRNRAEWDESMSVAQTDEGSSTEDSPPEDLMTLAHDTVLTALELSGHVDDHELFKEADELRTAGRELAEGEEHEAAGDTLFAAAERFLASGNSSEAMDTFGEAAAAYGKAGLEDQQNAALRRAAELGDLDAWIALGEPGKAAELRILWYRRAAEQEGVSEALFDANGALELLDGMDGDEALQRALELRFELLEFYLLDKVEARHGESNMERARHELGKAEQSLKDFTADAPEGAQEKFELFQRWFTALEHYNEGRNEEALTEFQALSAEALVAAEHDRFFELHFFVTLILEEHGDRREEAQAWELRGDVNMNIGDTRKATTAYDNAINAFEDLGADGLDDVVRVRSKAPKEDAEAPK